MSQDEICIGSSHDDDNHVVAHEVGHNLHKRALGINGSLTDGSCDNDNWTNHQPNKCTTAEGWADFVAAAMYFHPHATDPYYWVSTRKMEGDFQGDACVSEQLFPSARRGNVARFFWDLFDSTEEDEPSGGSSPPGFDNARTYFSTLVNYWDGFPPGYFNRQRNETGEDGVNVWDYQHYYTNSRSEIFNNCLNGQEP